ncbi:MAG: alpha/beta fold hydrolase [Burkholderiales bacterium]
MASVLFITGLGGKASFWSRQVAAFKERFNCITYDLGARNTVEALAQDALALLDARGVERAHIVGHSTGGAIAQVIASEHPERVERLVLSGTWSSPTAPFAALFKLRQRVLAELGPQPAAVLGALFAWPNEWLEEHPEQLELFDATDAQALLARMEAILAYDGHARLARIRAPTLVVCAEDDHLVPIAHSRRLAAGIAGAKLQLLPCGGHFPQATATREYNELLMGFLA